MNLKKEVLLSDVDDSVVAIATGKEIKFNGMIRMNSSAGFVAKLLQKPTTEDELVQKLCQEYEITETEARDNIKKVIDCFKQADFLEE